MPRLQVENSAGLVILLKYLPKPESGPASFFRFISKTRQTFKSPKITGKSLNAILVKPLLVNTIGEE